MAADMAEILDEIGVSVVWSGGEYSAILADPRVELDLQSGGFMPESDYSLKIRRADMEGIPAIRDVIEVQGQNYVVKGITNRPSSSVIVFHIARK